MPSCCDDAPDPPAKPEHPPSVKLKLRGATDSPEDLLATELEEGGVLEDEEEESRMDTDGALPSTTDEPDSQTDSELGFPDTSSEMGDSTLGKTTSSARKTCVVCRFRRLIDADTDGRCRTCAGKRAPSRSSPPTYSITPTLLSPETADAENKKAKCVECGMRRVLDPVTDTCGECQFDDFENFSVEPLQLMGPLAPCPTEGAEVRPSALRPLPAPLTPTLASALPRHMLALGRAAHREEEKVRFDRQQGCRKTRVRGQGTPRSAGIVARLGLDQGQMLLVLHAPPPRPEHRSVHGVRRRADKRAATRSQQARAAPPRCQVRFHPRQVGARTADAPRAAPAPRGQGGPVPPGPALRRRAVLALRRAARRPAARAPRAEPVRAAGALSEPEPEPRAQPVAAGRAAVHAQVR